MEIGKKGRRSRKKCVCIFPHTTNWDFVICILYACAQPNLLKHGYTIMKPQPFEIPFVGEILRKIGFIPATRR